MTDGGRIEIRLAGAGGQGVVTAGRILAEAAILSGKTATHSQVYGPQSRGGASRSDVVISDGEIGFPLAEHIDVLVALSPEAYARYETELSAQALLLIDEAAQGAPPCRSRPTRTLPIVSAARHIAGKPVLAGVVALGALQHLVDVVDRRAVEQAVGGRVTARHREMNVQALAAGARLAEEG
jgi:2-oxoglutarate ferredoxin oxidoreductase subunit gamma